MFRGKRDRRPEAVHRRDRRRRAMRLALAVFVAVAAGGAIAMGLDRLLGP